ncbi:hypothetical protein TIFTF001_030870 [Ficus carica]|uniref:Uncharacterized protein n=1 Tax=Ficus carica TaxID=3494 RepID=A0AA88DTW7_FICCA|nr:hypothetical protein TIFTF001_030870 [Ficus carica]
MGREESGIVENRERFWGIERIWSRCSKEGNSVKSGMQCHKSWDPLGADLGAILVQGRTRKASALLDRVSGRSSSRVDLTIPWAARSGSLATDSSWGIVASRAAPVHDGELCGASCEGQCTFPGGSNDAARRRILGR